MPLKLIGAGFGRTGTTSIKLAYEQLGLGRCYHMIEVFSHPGATGRWIRAANGDVDWEEMFNGYTASVDWPGCHFWRELIALYPHAKVLLSVRDPEAWFASTQATIFSDLTDRASEMPPDFMAMYEKVVAADVGGDVSDRAACIAAFERHNAEVIRSVPKDRLLVYDVKEGWKPLCRFLDVPVPDAPFPRANTSQDWASSGPPSQRVADGAGR